MTDTTETPTRIKGLHEAMELIKQSDPEMMLSADLHFHIGQLRQAVYLLTRGVVTDQEGFADRLIQPTLEFLELLDEA